MEPNVCPRKSPAILPGLRAGESSALLLLPFVRIAQRVPAAFSVISIYIIFTSNHDHQQTGPRVTQRGINHEQTIYFSLAQAPALLVPGR